MRKIFTLFLAAMLTTVTAMAATLQRKAYSDEISDSVTIVYADETTPGVVEFVWQGNSEVSPAYSMTLASFDTTTYSVGYLSMLASYASNFATDEEGFFGFSTDYLLYYGDNYSTIGTMGAPDDVVAKWQIAWMASVNEDGITLKPGFYVIFVEGINLSLETTEAEDYAIFSIAEVESAVSVINSIDSKPMKVFNSNGIYIISNGHKYDMLGNIVR